MLAVIAVFAVGIGALVLLIGVARSVVYQHKKMEPGEVAKRAVELQLQRSERRIAEIGEATRKAILEAMERNR